MLKLHTFAGTLRGTNKMAKRLFSAVSEFQLSPSYSSRIDKLPEPVKRYFNRVLSGSEPEIYTVRIKHDGQFKTSLNSDWMPINGRQFITTQMPGFVWEGKTRWFTARDYYIEGRGGLSVYLLGLVRVVNAKGVAFDQGELLRWLGEAVWYPTVWLPGENLRWEPINKNQARVNFYYKGLEVNYEVTFNQEGFVTEMKTRRYMDVNRIETWIGRTKNWQLLNGIMVPTEIEAIWRIDNQDYPYARFRVKHLDYNQPHVF